MLEGVKPTTKLVANLPAIRAPGLLPAADKPEELGMTDTILRSEYEQYQSMVWWVVLPWW